MFNVAHDLAAAGDDTAAGGSSLLDEIVRDGARQMLAAALQAEFAAYIQAHSDALDEDGRRLVVRNGFHGPWEVTTSAGAVAVRQPRVNDKRTDEVTGQRPAVLLGDPAGLGAQVPAGPWPPAPATTRSSTSTSRRPSSSPERARRASSA